jgi:hypothetical protein
MQRVNKNMRIEEDEESEEDIEEVLKEFLDSNLEKIGSVLKSGGMSIPVFGDIFAFGKFLFTITKLRFESRRFSHQLSKLTGIDVGDDILEPEGSLQSAETLDRNLRSAILRLENLNDYPELNVTKKDIDSLQAKYFIMCKYVKDGMIEFIGFADVAFGQKGFFLNFGLSMITYSSLPDFIVGEYADIINNMYEKSKDSNSSVLAILKKAASFFISTPRKMLDFLGNADLFLNPDKLARLALVHNMFKKYHGADSYEEKATLGLDAIPGTPFDNWLEENYADYSPEAYSKYSGTVETLDSLTNLATSAPETSKFLSDIVKDQVVQEAHDIVFREDLNLMSIYEALDEDEDEEDDSLEEFSGGGVAMSALPLGTKTGKSSTSGGKNSIYTASDVRNFQNFASKTLGNKK